MGGGGRGKCKMVPCRSIAKKKKKRGKISENGSIGEKQQHKCTDKKKKKKSKQQDEEAAQSVGEE